MDPQAKRLRHDSGFEEASREFAATRSQRRTPKTTDPQLLRYPEGPDTLSLRNEGFKTISVMALGTEVHDNYLNPLHDAPPWQTRAPMHCRSIAGVGLRSKLEEREAATDLHCRNSWGPP